VTGQSLMVSKGRFVDLVGNEGDAQVGV